MIMLLLGVLLFAFILALFSMRDYQGHDQVKKIQEALHKERIKGTIVLPRDGGKRGTHYSSYSS
jgi:hypothetical protein